MKQVLENKKTSFKCAYRRIPIGDIREVLNRLKVILNLKTDAPVYQYIRGDKEPKLTEAIAIEKLFLEYGIKVDWNCDEKEEQS